MKLYHESLFRYEGLKSPYLYPRYGLGELPQVRVATLAHWMPSFSQVCSKSSICQSLKKKKSSSPLQVSARCMLSLQKGEQRFDIDWVFECNCDPKLIETRYPCPAQLTYHVAHLA